MEYRIQGLDTREFMLVSLPRVPEGESLPILPVIQYGVRLPQPEHLVIRLSIQGTHQESEVFRLVLDFFFKLETPLEQNEAGQRVFPKEVAAHLGAVAYASSRGVLHEKLRETALRTFVLPSRNIIQEFPEDLLLTDPNAGPEAAAE